MQYERINEMVNADELCKNDVFVKAVDRVLSRYTRIEEDYLMDDSHDVRERNANIVRCAMMRKAVQDIVSELNEIIRLGEEEQMSLDLDDNVL